MESTHPLKYIAQTFQIPLSDIANELGIKRQSINEWVGKRRRDVPEKHISKIAALFNLDEKWFRKKDLTGSERLELQRIYIDRNATFIEYEDVIIDDEGNSHEVTKYYSQEQELSSHLFHLEQAERLIEMIKQLIDIETDAHDDFYQELFRKVITVTKSINRNKVKMLHDVLNYLAYRDHEAGFMVLEDDNKTVKLDELMGLYEKK
jgi:transcriptional regulator with XRE-family HTH domain